MKEGIVSLLSYIFGVYFGLMTVPENSLYNQSEKLFGMSKDYRDVEKMLTHLVPLSTLMT
ncbi:MAG: hypothetical protein WB502_08390 [Thermoactinomyces sp.]